MPCYSLIFDPFVQDLVDVNGITTNDVGAVLQSLGVEAARSALLTEIARVFGVYGIGVDQRHLSLIADFMTHQVRRPAAPTRAIALLSSSSDYVDRRPVDSFHCIIAGSPPNCHLMDRPLPQPAGRLPRLQPPGHRFQCVALPQDQLRDGNGVPHGCASWVAVANDQQ